MAQERQETREQEVALYPDATKPACTHQALDSQPFLRSEPASEALEHVSLHVSSKDLLGSTEVPKLNIHCP
jgi:hypothetical protein